MSEDIISQLIVMADKRRTLEQGAYLFHQGEPVRSVFVVEEGLIELTRIQLDGSPIVLQHATRETFLAEASAYSESYHCDAVVATPTSVYELPKVAFPERLGEDGAFSRLWATHLAKEIQAARYRSEILSRKTVAERLDGWLAWHADGIPEKGRWKEIATQISVSPEALYRELARRRAG